MPKRPARDGATCGSLSSSLDGPVAMGSRVLETSYRLGQAVSTVLDIERLCDLVLDLLADTFRPWGLALLFLDEPSGELCVKRRSGPAVDGIAEGCVVAEGAAVAVALAERRLVVMRPGDPMLQLPARLDPFATAGSLVAVPLVAEGKVKGVLGLTWAPDDGAVDCRPSDEDLRMLRVLAGQVAAAIDNAWLYGELRRLNASLEEKVRARTAQLEAAMDELRHTQSQVLQAEKMASLGQLIAGVAHEINNPLAFSINNVAMATERLSVIERRFRLLATQAMVAQAHQDSARLAHVISFVESLQDDPRYGPDVASFRADLEGLPAEAAAELGVEFLGYVRGREEQAHSDARLYASTRHLLERAVDGLHRVEGIVLDLRRFSRLDGAELQTVDVDAALASTLAMADEMARQRGVELTYERGMHSPYACYPAKLSQMLLNLVTNALQASPPGGKVRVSTRETDAGPTIEVADEGHGIPESIAGRIFDPFFTTKPVGQGTGLGLSVSYRVIEEHGGTVDVQSEEGKGTIFRVRLPPRRAPAEEKDAY